MAHRSIFSRIRGLGAMVICGALMLAGNLLAETSDSQIVDFLRYHFSKLSKSNQTIVASHISPEDLKSLGLHVFDQMGFQPKDLWGNKDYVFGYGSLRDGTLLMVAWKNRIDAPHISLKELSGVYTDERLAVVQDDKGLLRWRKVREEVAGAFISVRKNEGHLALMYPFSSAESSGRDSFKQLQLEKRPLIVRFQIQSGRVPKNLLGSVEALPER